jgi:hypothetical protein
MTSNVNKVERPFLIPGGAAGGMRSVACDQD